MSESRTEFAGGLSSRTASKPTVSYRTETMDTFVQGLPVSSDQVERYDPPQTNLSNSLREEVSNVVSELAVLRQGINTLRLADTQYEMQSADVSRRLRELDAQVRADMQVQAMQLQELKNRISEHPKQMAVQIQPDTQSALPRSPDLLGDRLPKMVSVSEDQSASLQLSLDRMRVFHNELASEVQSMKDDLDGKVREMKSTFRRDLGNLGEEMEEKAKNALNKFADMSLKDQLSQVSTQLTKAASVRSAGLEELIFKAASQEKAAREELASNCKTDLENALLTLARLRSEVSDLVKSGAQAVPQGNIRELVAREQGFREKADAAFSDRLSDFEKWSREQFGQLSKDQSTRHADLKDLVSKLKGQTKVAQDDLVSSYKGELRDGLGKLRGDITDHKTATDELQFKLRALAADDRNQRETVEEGLRQSLKNLEHDVKETASEFCNFREKAASHVMLESLGQKVNGELSRLSDECDLKYTQLRTLAESHSSALAGVEQKLQDEHRKMVEAHEQEVDAIQREHVDLVDVVSKFSTDHNAMKADIHSSFREQMQGLEQRLHEFFSHQLSDCEGRISGLTVGLASLDRKLREELSSASTAEFARISELKEHLAKFSGENSREITDLKERVDRNVSQQKGLVDDSRNYAMTAIQASESKLWREVSAKIDETHVTVHEHLGKHRQDHVTSLSSIKSRMEDLDQKVRDAVEQVAVVRETNSESAFSNLLSGSEEKLRADLLRMEEDSRGKMADIKDQFQRALTEQASRQTQLKECFSKTSSDEKRAREDCRSSLASSIEQLEVKLRRDLAAASERNQSGLRDWLTQEAQQREQMQKGLAEQQTDLERRLMGELSQACLETAASDMREAVLATCSKDREHMQTLLSKEQQFRVLQIEKLEKQFLQEKTARETQQESLRVYLTNEKMAQESFLRREEHEAQMKKLHLEVRSHTHDLNVQPQPTPASTPMLGSRSPMLGSRSPLLGTRQIPAVDVWTQKPMAVEAQVLRPQTAALIQQLAAPPVQQMCSAEIPSMLQDQTYEREAVSLQSRGSSVACSPGLTSGFIAREGLQFQSLAQEAPLNSLALPGNSSSTEASTPQQCIPPAPTGPLLRVQTKIGEAGVDGGGSLGGSWLVTPSAATGN